MGLIFACLGCHFRLGSKRKTGKMTCFVWFRAFIPFGVTFVGSSKKNTPLGWLEIIQSLLGSCKAEFIQELDALEKDGTTWPSNKKEWLREKAVR